MAQLTILTPDELAERETKPGHGRSGRRRSAERERIISEYKEALATVEPGFGADVTLTAAEDKRVVRQNLKVAAHDLHLALEFRPIKDRTRIHFRVLTPEQAAARPKRGGRPRKNRA